MDQIKLFILVLSLEGKMDDKLGDPGVTPGVTANLCCNFAYPYWEGCVICSIYLR